MKFAIYLTLLVVGLVSPSTFFLSAVVAQTEPATARQAAAVLDFSEFEMVEPVDEPNALAVARQSYRSKCKLPEIGERLRQKLKEAGCEELAGATFTDSYGSAVYRKDGFTYSLMVYAGSEPHEVMVGLINHGNVNLKTLPVPDGSTEQFALPNMVAYISSKSVAETTESCLELLKKQGWKPFGETTVSFFVKRNAVIIQVMVSTAPALEGKTSIQISSELMSVDLPAPPYAGVMQYSDPGNMLFDSQLTQSDLISFFKTELGKSDWQATTENPIKIGFREHLIFRNPAKEYLELDFQEVDGNVRTQTKYQTAMQFAESEKRAREKAEELRNQKQSKAIKSNQKQ